MAHRVHVIATKSDSAELLGALDGMPIERRGSSKRWSWAVLSDEAAGPHSLDGRLNRLDDVVLRFTTLDGSGWHYRLSGDEVETVDGYYWFSVLDEENVEMLCEEYETVGELAAELILPQEDYDKLRDVRLERVAVKSLVQKMIGRHVGALHALGLGSAKKFTATLNGEGISEVELGWDLGNLPKLLAALGMPDVFPEWDAAVAEEIADREARRQVLEEAQAALAADPLREIMRVIGDTVPMPVDGGLLDVPLDQLRDLSWISSRTFIHHLDGIALTADGNEEVVASLDPLCAAVAVKDGMIEACLDGGGSGALLPISEILGEAVDGSSLEFFSVELTENNDARHHHFRGTIEGRRFLLAEVHPATDLATLRGSLELAHSTDGVDCVNEDERHELQEAVHTSFSFPGVFPWVIVRDLRIELLPHSTNRCLAEQVFYRRYESHWGEMGHAERLAATAAGSRRSRQDQDERDAAYLERITVGPATEAAVADYEGAAVVKSVRSKARAVGLDEIGWLTAVDRTRADRPWAVLCFCSTDRTCAVSVAFHRDPMAGRISVGQREVISRLEDGTFVVTLSPSVSWVVNFDRGVFKMESKNGRLDGMLPEHIDRVAQMASRPRPVGEDLDSLTGLQRLWRRVDCGLEKISFETRQ